MSVRSYEALKQQEAKKVSSLPVYSVVRRVLPESESVKVEIRGERGSSTISVRHPYFGVNSWIRCMPEDGASCMTQPASNPSQPEIWGWISRRTGDLVQRAKDDNTVIFRQLNQGEIEIMSSGNATTYWTSEGDLLSLAGVCEQDLSQTQLQARVRAPTHKKETHRNVPTTLAHEERFGLVKRADSQSPNTKENYVKEGSTFQYEYGRWLYDASDKALVTLQEGNVYDTSGNQVKENKTNRLVRSQRTYYHRSTGTLMFTVDEELNVVVVNTSKAKTTDIDLGTKNGFKLSSEKMDFQILKSSNQTYGTSLTFKAPKIRATSSDVGLGSNPVQPVILGNVFINSTIKPALQVIGTSLQGLAAEPALSAASKSLLSAASTSISVIVSSLSSSLSTQVKVS